MAVDETMRQFVRYLLISLLPVVLMMGSVQAKSPPPGTGKADVPANILFMLDVSGSMSAATNSKTRMYYPTDVAVDSQGNIFVAEYSYHRIKKYNSSGTLLKTIGRYGSSNGRFRYPYKIAIDSSDNIYVSDYYNHRVQKLNNDGVWQRNFTGINYPLGVAVDSSGNVYAGQYNYRGTIRKWNSSGTYITQWSSRYPAGLSVYGGYVYATDYPYRKINKYSDSGTLQTSWSTSNNAYPFDVEVTSNGVYVANIYHKVQKYSTSGTYSTQWGSYGAGNSNFRYVHGIGSDSSGNIYVADFYNHASKKFDSSGTYLSSIGGDSGTRLGELKKVIKRIVSTSDLTSGANFGLMKWSHYAQMLVNISSSGASEIYSKIDSLSAGGGTYLDSAMSLAQSYMYGSNSPINKNASCQKNILIVMSDGYWYDRKASNIAKSFNAKGIKTFVIGFHTAGNSNYTKLSKAGGTYPESPLYSNNWQHLYETLSNYIRQAISSRLTFTAPALMPNVSGGSDHILQASFKYKADHQWEGHLTKYKLKTDGTVGDSVWDAGKKLDSKSESSRQIWTILNWLGVSTSINNFSTTNDTALEAALYEGAGKTPSSTELSNLINFVRGIDTYDEDADSNSSEERWKLGDIYHSSPIVVGKPSASTTSNASGEKTEAYYRHQNSYNAFATGNSCGGSCSSRTEMVYAGGNDGMLHAFNSSSGEEEWAFIPPSLLPRLRDMDAAKANTSHSVFGVDGTPVVRDIYYSGSWKTVLLGGLGRGGHGYYALDVTDPDNPSFLFSFSNHPTDQLVRYWDSNGDRYEYSYAVSGSVPSDYDFSALGEAWSTPQIFPMPVSGGGRKWVAVFGAGYNGGINSDYGSAVYVINLEDGGKILKRIDLTDGSGNIANSVPSDITLITPDTTSKADYKGAMAYVADLESKLWKINLTDQGTLYEKTEIFDAEATHDNDRFNYYAISPSIGKDGNLWIYYGTGDQQRLQRMSGTIENRLFGIKDTDFPKYSAVTSSTIKKMKNTTSKGGLCPADADLGWYVNLNTNEKITGKIAISNETVFASRYTPNKSNICNPGTAKLTEHDYACGNVTADTDLGVGIATGAVIYKNRIYIGISGTGKKSGTLPKGWSQKDNIIVGTPSKASKGKGAVQYESWREIF